MQTLIESRRGLGLLIQLGWDRMMSFFMLALCLTLSAYVASVTLANPFIL